MSLYGDFLYPLAEDSTLEKFYDEKPEGEFCAELHAARAEVWKVLRPYRMKLLRLALVCRIYGVEDNPKENRLFGMNLEEALEQVGIQPSEVWDQEEHLLWFAKIYPECGNIRDIELQPETKKELNERFCLIYTGQRRLARNLLRDVVGRYVGNEPDSLYALNEIQKVAALMRFELERGKIDEFADLLNYHWELSRKVDAGSTNTLIDQIFLSIEDLIDAKMVCGAGGGGFLQVILKKGVQKADVHKRL